MNQTSEQTPMGLILPLLIILFMAVGLAYMLPKLSTGQTLLLAGGIVFFIICLVSSRAAIYLLILSMLLSPEFIVGETKGSSMGRGITLRIDDFILILVGFSWLAKMAIHKKLGLFLQTPLNKPIGFYLMACLTSTFLGAMFLNVHLKTGFFFVLKYFEYVFVYFMLANHLENKRQIRNLTWALLFTCVIVSLVGITQIPLGERVSAPFEGEAGEPNTFGGYLVFMMCIAAGLLLASNSFRSQILYGSLICLFLVPFFYTQSRTSYLALIPASFSFVWLSGRRQWAFLVLLLAGTLLPFIAPHPAKERVAYTFTQGEEFPEETFVISGVRLDTSTSARVKSWKEVARDWIKHPVFGFGITGYEFVDAQYFRVLIETGLLGLTTFLFLLFSIFRHAHQVVQKTSTPFEKGLSMGFLSGFVGLIFHGFGANTFIIVRIMEPFWFVLAMVIMIPNLKNGDLDDPASPASPVHRGNAARSDTDGPST